MNEGYASQFPMHDDALQRTLSEFLYFLNEIGDGQLEFVSFDPGSGTVALTEYDVSDSAGSKTTKRTVRIEVVL